MKHLALICAILLLGVSVLVSGAAPLAGPEPLLASAGKVDMRVLEDTAEGRIGHFIVVLQAQADTREAAMHTLNREARGHVVFDALRQTASTSQPAVRAELEKYGARYRAYWIVNLIAVEGNREVVEALAARADVKAIESNRAFRVPLEKPEEVAPARAAGAEWNIVKVNAPAVWDKGYTGQGRVYANADTGVQWDHPALKSHYRGWNGTTADHNYNWWDAIHTDLSGNGSNPCGFSTSAPCDDHGHGTHTLGTGVGDDGAGNQIGVAPGAKWIACRNMESGVGRPSTYIECMQFFMAPTDLAGQNPDPNRRPDAVGNSYGCPPDELCSPNSLQAAMNNLRAAGVFMSVSAGNAGPDCSTVNDPPALQDAAISVGATTSEDHIVGFSSRGPVTVDGSNRRKPDLVAPGFNVRSSYPPNSYAFLSGTSMASPHVAGAVVLLWSAFPQLRRDVDTTQHILEQTALHLTTTQGCGGDTASQVPNNVYGYGRLDVLAAYNYAAQNPTPTSTVSPSRTPTAMPTAISTVTPTPTPAFCPDYFPPPGVGVEDIQAAAARWHNPAAYDPRFDTDQNGVIDAVDVMLIASLWSQHCNQF